MSLQTKTFRCGDLLGTVFTFPLKGDKLPWHSHGENDVHIMIVARGSVTVLTEGKEPQDYSAGAVVDNEAPITHEIVAKEDNSRIVNIIKRMEKAT